MGKIRSPEELERLREEILSRRDPKKPCITLCSGTACTACGSDKVAVAIREELKNRGLEDKIDLRRTGCHGFCEKGPVTVIFPEETCYLLVTPEDVPKIVDAIEKGTIAEELVYVDPTTQEKVVREPDIPFYKHSRRILFTANRLIDPKNIEDYIAIGGYKALAKALFEMGPEKILEEVKKSGLRGRGGAGFPTGVKWEICRNVEGDTKYVIINCDEGDPGAYMDRSLMEGNPHSVIEGVTIGAYAIGAHEGYIYVRQEYPLAVENVNIAIKQAEEYGFLGEDILGSGFNFRLHVHRGGGAFVCGEESALIASLEGKVGEPRQRPPYPAVRGLWGKPTNINNVETWANIPLIINNGAEWFSSIGTEGSKGTKIFSLVGKVNNTGLVEVPMGITLRDIVYKIGGGIPGGKKFKAVQTGGPSGGCIPESMLDLPVDFDELTKAGSMMGSGGMIVMDEETCMVDVARYFIDFLRDESCGKCTTCREGLRQMYGILDDIVAGRGKEEDIDLLEELAEVVRDASLCALGGTAPNPVLSTLRYFRDEYEAHIKEKRCPALVCKELISYYIDPELCKACMRCLKVCPANAIIGEKKKIHVIDQEKCTKCGACYEVCPPKFRAVKKISGEPVPPPIPEEERWLKGGKKNE
ncbi:MAG: NADH-quinone oxidoreductase subunit NuoF [Candidatus Syntropharchaeia archaeon]